MDSSRSSGLPLATETVSGQASGTKAARILYYLGMALLTDIRFRPAHYLDPSDLAFLAALFAVLPILPRVRLTLTRGPEQYPPVLLYGCLVFAAGGVFSAFQAPDFTPAVFEAGEFLYLTVAWYGLSIIVLRTHAQVTTAVHIWMMSAAASGFAAVGQSFFNVLVPPEYYGRATGFAYQQNDLGGLAAVAFVPAVALAVRRSRSRLQTIVASIVLLAVVAGLILSGSLGGLLATITGFTFFVAMLFTRRHRSRSEKRRLGVAALTAVAGVLWLSFQPGSDAYGPLARIASVTGQHNRQGEDPTLVSRLAIDDVAARAIASHPLLGSGLSDEAAVGEIGQPVHNMLLGVWFGAGLPGIVGLVIILLSLTATARAVVRDARSPDEWLLAVALGASLLSFVTFSMSAPILIVRYGWAPGAMLLALRAVQKREMSRDAGRKTAR